MPSGVSATSSAGSKLSSIAQITPSCTRLAARPEIEVSCCGASPDDPTARRPSQAASNRGVESVGANGVFADAGRVVLLVEVGPDDAEGDPDLSLSGSPTREHPEIIPIRPSAAIDAQTVTAS